jgi:hypothetical protein
METMFLNKKHNPYQGVYLYGIAEIETLIE